MNFKKGDTFNRMRAIAGNIKADIEDLLTRTFSRWEVTEYTLPTETEDGYYRLNIRVNDNGFVRVKTIERDSGHGWVVIVEEFDEGNAKEATITIPTIKGSQISGNIDAADSEDLTNISISVRNKVQAIARDLRKDIGLMLGKNFSTFNLLEYTALADEITTQYDMKIKIDGNGHLRLMVQEKEPGKTWEIFVEEYVRDDSIDKGDYRLPQGSDASIIISSHAYDIFPLNEQIKSEIQTFAGFIKTDVQLLIGQTSLTFGVLEHGIYSDLESTYFQMRIETDNNGYAQVKTSKNLLAKDWNIQVEDFDKGTTPTADRLNNRDTRTKKENESTVHPDLMNQSVTAGEA